MDNILSIVTFIPALAAAVMALFLRGEDAAAQQNAKWIALLATTITTNSTTADSYIASSKSHAAIIEGLHIFLPR